MRAVVLSFDNLGEASELERGRWTGPLRRHPSVRFALPRLLDELDALGLRATFFVEGLNCELYPEAVREIAGRGHELGAHGWRHEAWARLAPGRERELLLRAGAAFSSLGLAAQAFRPPGGEPTAATPDLLSELGYRWWSPVAGSGSGPVSIPFEWERVDAYHLMERFAPLRVERGDRAEPLPAPAVADRLCAGLASAAGTAGTQVVVLHPFLMLDPLWWDGARRVLAVLAGLARDGAVRVEPGGKIAEAAG